RPEWPKIRTEKLISLSNHSFQRCGRVSANSEAANYSFLPNRSQTRRGFRLAAYKQSNAADAPDCPESARSEPALNFFFSQVVIGQRWRVRSGRKLSPNFADFLFGLFEFGARKLHSVHAVRACGFDFALHVTDFLEHVGNHALFGRTQFRHSVANFTRHRRPLNEI